MSVRTFFSDEARKQAEEAVEALESNSGAEVAVALRAVSGHYRHTDLLVGFAASLAALTFLLYTDHPVAPHSFPLDVGLAFLLGALLCSRLAPLRRLLTSRKLQRECVQRTARSLFVERGVLKTRARTGVLVYVSVFEQAVELVPDVGLEEASRLPAWTAAQASMQQALVRGDLAGFLAAFRSLGPVLQQAAPKQQDDVNELPNQVVAG